MASSASASSIAPDSSISNQDEGVGLRKVLSPVEMGVDFSVLEPQQVVQVLTMYYRAVAGCSGACSVSGSSGVSSFVGTRVSVQSGSVSSSGRRRRRRAYRRSSELSSERSSRVGGCYLQAIAVSEREKVYRQCGPYPTVSQLLDVAWVDVDQLQLQSLKLVAVGSGFHVGKCGTPLLAALRAVASPECRLATLGRVLSSSSVVESGVPGLTLDSIVGGSVMPITDPVAPVKLSLVSPGLSLVEPTASDTGYCYLGMIVPSSRRRVAAALGAFPTFQKLITVAYADTVKLDAMVEMFVEKYTRDIYHISDNGVSLAAVLAKVSSRYPENSEPGSLAERAKGWGVFDEAAYAVDSSFSLGGIGRRERSESQEIACDSSFQVVFEGEANVSQDGWCYLKVIKPFARVACSAALGPWPKLTALLGVSFDWWDGDAAERLRLVSVSGTRCHVVEAGLGPVLSDVRSGCAVLGKWDRVDLDRYCVGGTRAERRAKLRECGSLQDREFAWRDEFLKEFPEEDADRVRYVVALPVSEDYSEPRVVGTGSELGGDGYRVLGAFPRGCFLCLPVGSIFGVYRADTRRIVVRLCCGVDQRFIVPAGQSVSVREWACPPGTGAALSLRFVAAFASYIDTTRRRFQVPFGRAGKVGCEESGQGWQRFECDVVLPDVGAIQIALDLGCYGSLVVGKFESSVSVEVRFGSATLTTGSHQADQFYGLTGPAGSQNQLLLVGRPGRRVKYQYIELFDDYAFDGGGLSCGRSEHTTYSRRRGAPAVDL